MTGDDRGGHAHDDQADRWLVDRAREGDTDAYEVLVRRHRDRIYRIALRMLGSVEDAEDATQDVTIQLWAALSGFTGASMFTTWLYRVVVNRCLNVRRARRPTEELQEQSHPHTRGTEDTVIGRERASAGLAAISNLPPELRAPLVLHQVEGLSYREVASVLRLSEDTVRGRLHRARRTVLHELRDWS